MSKRRAFRACASLGLALGGAALLAYGLFFHVTVVSSAKDAEANVLTRPEPVLIYDVTIGQERPPVEVAEAPVESGEPDVQLAKPPVESGDPGTELAKPAVESTEPNVALAKQGDAPQETKEPKTAPQKEAPKACPT